LKARGPLASKPLLGPHFKAVQDFQNMTATFEPGLSGTGPLPVHLHTGKPTPWSEGCVVRFLPESGQSWIANLQTGWGYARKIIAWDKADAFIVIANGASYFVCANQPERWRFHDLTGIDCVIAPAGQTAILTTHTDIVAISTDGSELWRRTVAVDGVEGLRIENGLIYGSAGVDPPDEWQPFLLRLSDGKELEPGAAPSDRPADSLGNFGGSEPPSAS
jgi:hypothetical protein